MSPDGPGTLWEKAQEPRVVGMNLRRKRDLGTKFSCDKNTFYVDLRFNGIENKILME